MIVFSRLPAPLERGLFHLKSWSSRENLCRGSPTSRADAGVAGHRRADKRRRAVMLEVGHTATRLSCFAPVSRCCDGSARAGSQTSKLPGSGVLATRYPDLSKPRVRTQAVPRPLPCSYGARCPWCARLGKASSRSEHVAKIYVLTGSRAGPTPAGMEFNRPRTKNYSVAALSGSTIRVLRGASRGSYQVVQTATARPCCSGRSRQHFGVT